MNWNLFFYRLAWVLLFAVPIFFVGKLIGQMGRHPPSVYVAPPRASSDILAELRKKNEEAEHAYQERKRRLDAEYENWNRRREKCIAMHGIPSPGLDDTAEDRFGLVCLKVSSIIYVDDMAW